MKYIIKNCPAFVKNSYKNSDWAIENACSDTDDRCCINHNCLLKQIVSECNKYKYAKGVELTDFARKEVALHILDKLEIEECE